MLRLRYEDSILHDDALTRHFRFASAPLSWRRIVTDYDVAISVAEMPQPDAWVQQLLAHA